jgi:hypothetical protein
LAFKAIESLLFEPFLIMAASDASEAGPTAKEIDLSPRARVSAIIFGTGLQPHERMKLL